MRIIEHIQRLISPRRWWMMAMVPALWGAICGLQPTMSLAAGDPVWITVQAQAPIMPGQEDAARQEAVAAAVQKAIDELVTAKISMDALLVQLKLSGYILGAIPYARVVDRQIISESRQPCQGDDTRAAALCHCVQLKAAVVEESAGMDPQFKIRAVLNQRFFHDGDAIQIQLQATEDCYGYIFDLLENGQVLRLLPNRYASGHRLKANQPFIFPGRSTAAGGMRLVAHGLDNQPVTQEAFYCLALKQPLGNTALDKIQEGLLQLYGQDRSFMRELIRLVVRIPLDKRAEAMLRYQIIKSDQIVGSE